MGDTKLSFEPLGITVREDALLINGLENFMRVYALSGDLGALQDTWFKSRTWIKQLP